MLDKFNEVFSEVRCYLLAEGLESTSFLQDNPKSQRDKDQATLVFDKEAERIAIEGLKARGVNARILSEETGEVRIGGEPEFTIIMDPVDGSTNFSRKIESTAFSIAAIPIGKTLTPTNVEYAFIGSVWSGNTFSAQKGEGAFYNGKPCSSSKTTEVEKALIGMDLDFSEKEKWRRVMPLINKCHMIRRGGAASLDAAFVSIGGYDSIVDVRDRTTPENFMAAYLIITESGGLLTDASGNELPEIEMTKTYNWVASGNKELHKKIVELIGKGIC